MIEPNKIKDGGPAFPAAPDEIGETTFPNRGMSLRDWFAGMALQGWYASMTGDDFPHESGRKLIAEMCYQTAGAMIAEREKGMNAGR